MPQAGEHLTSEQIYRMQPGGTVGLAIKARRAHAINLIRAHLAGQRASDARTFVLRGNLSGIALENFITRMETAYGALPTDSVPFDSMTAVRRAEDREAKS